MEKRKAIFVDDEQAVLDGYRRLLHNKCRKWDINFIENGQKALELMSHENVDLVVTDLKMPTMSGIELLEKVNKHFPGTLTAVITGHGDLESAVKAMQLGAFNYLKKPVDIEGLKASLNIALEKLTLRGHSDENQNSPSAEKKMKVVHKDHNYQCPGCNTIIDCSGVAPFTVCACPECDSKISIPLKMKHLILARKLYNTNYFNVYEGYDVNNEITSVVSVSNESLELAMSKEMLKESIVNARTLHNFQHTNISPLVSFGSIGRKFYVTEPAIKGHTLAEQNLAYDMDEILDVFQQIMVAVTMAHHRKITHHNICLENVHVDIEGNVRLKNFFISWFDYTFDQLMNARPSTSPYFISPEKAETGKEDFRGDIFSVGVLFYFLLTGTFPFDGENSTDIIKSRIKKGGDASENSHPLSPNRLKHEIPDNLNSLIMSMLEYDPDARINSTEIIDILTKCQQRNQTDSEQLEKCFTPKGVLVVQESMLLDSGTKTIPMMKNLARLLKN